MAPLLLFLDMIYERVSRVRVRGDIFWNDEGLLKHPTPNPTILHPAALQCPLTQCRNVLTRAPFSCFPLDDPLWRPSGGLLLQLYFVFSDADLTQERFVQLRD